ncbi:oligosaccharide flippase family protein [Bacteroides oleiciplenus]|nr:oligosaccharide flippase family protein [Bacteroides oleiciplenus]
MKKNQSLLLKLSSHSFWYFVGGVLNNGLALLLLPYLSQMLTPAEYGIVQTANSIGLCLPILFSFHIEAAFARFYHDEKLKFENVCKLYSSCFWFIIFSGLFFLSLLILTSKFWFQTIFDVGPYPYIFLITYPYLFYQISILGSTYLRQTLNVKLVTSIDFVASLINLSLSIYLVYVWNDGAEARLFAISISFFIKALFYISYSIKRHLLIWSIDFSKLKSLLYFSIPLTPSALSLWLSKMADRIIISIYVGVAATGLFSVANQIALLVYFIQDAVLQALGPIQMDGFIKDRVRTLHYTKNLSEIMWILIINIILFVGLFSDMLLDLFVNSRFHVNSLLIIILSSVYLIQAQYRIFSGILIYHKKAKEYSYAAVAQAIISIALNFVFIPLYGYEVAAYTSLAGIIVFFVIILFYIRKIEKVQIDYMIYGKYILFLITCLLFRNVIDSFLLSPFLILLCKVLLFILFIMLSLNDLLLRLKLIR